jgi:hypothetical protein
MSDYGIDVFNFEFWQGPPPVVPTQKIIVTHRPGVNGVAHQLIGTWGDTFDVVLTSHWATFLHAIQGHQLMNSIIGTGGVMVKYNNINWSSFYGVLYHVEAIEILNLRTALWFVGPTYSFPNGGELVTRFTLTPQKV